MTHNKKFFDAGKRLVDICVSAAALIVTAPLQLGTAVLVLKALGRPVLFRQQRPGKDGQLFELVKFRTMLLPAPDQVTDEERMTKTGAFLRSTSLDELPTLFNVLRGDMSLVGPRPLLPEYLSMYTEEQARRHEVRPGVTGLAQISGRNALSWNDRFKLDVEYVDKRSIKLDFQILVRTFKSVLTREGINQEGHVTMAPFRGTDRGDASKGFGGLD